MRDIWTEKGRDPDRIREMCELLKEAWEKSPDQRFGQFLLNYVFQKKNLQSQQKFKQTQLPKRCLKKMRQHQQMRYYPQKLKPSHFFEAVFLLFCENLWFLCVTL